MSAKNFSHAACQHPSTKVARAKCRRQMAAAALVIAVVTDSPIITAWNEMKAGPLELTAGEAITISAQVTRENWREYKGETVAVVTKDDEATVRGTVTGWSEKLVQVKGEKVVRIPVENVEGVFTV